MSSSEGKPSGTSQKVTPEKRDKKSKEAMSSSKDIKKRLKEVSPKALVKKLSFITDSKKSKEKKKAKLKTEVEFSGADSDTTVSQETLCSIDSVTIVETKQDGAGGGDNEAPQSPDAPPPIKTVADGEGQKPPSAAGSSQPAAAKAPAAATGTTAPPSTPKLVDSARLEDIPSMEFLSLSASEANAGAKRECLYKILVIGELGTGKTSIIKRYVHQFFSQHYRATIGVDFALKVLNWDQNTIIRLQLWDIAGQERFGNMTRVYYKEAVGAFIVFDVTRAATFDAVVKWKQDLDAKVQLPDGSPIPCVLLANKCDQQKEGLVNTPNKMNEYCNEHRFTGWFETSAKENINIEEAAKLLVSQILNNDVTSENGQTNDPNRIALDGTDDAHHKSCNC